MNADHSNDTKPYIIATYENGSAGYVVWSDGRCEQTNSVLASAASTTGRYTVALFLPYKNKGFYLGLTVQRDAASSAPDSNILEVKGERTESSFHVRTGYANSGNQGHLNLPFEWHAIGYTDDSTIERIKNEL